MKVLLLIGNQLRHLYLAKQVIEMFSDTSIFVMSREEMVPAPPSGTTARDSRLFRHHFNLRNETERSAFGSLTLKHLVEHASTKTVSADQLNSNELARVFVDLKPDVCLVFGTNLIKEPVLSTLPNLTFNLHLGLSPWYRGSATLFWPFYFMEPQWAGVTVHQLIEHVDAGSIAFQCTPTLKRGMGIHDVGCAAVLAACREVLEMLNAIRSGSTPQLSQQRSTGRIFRVRDFRPVHLRVNYELFADRMTDSWLDGDLLGNVPTVVPLSYVR